MTKTMVNCPRHEGAYDCTPFCDVCEGEQVYEHTATRPCRGCGTSVEHDVWFEELSMCLDCSDAYWSHKDEDGE
jgi:hypothetical protein